MWWGTWLGQPPMGPPTTVHPGRFWAPKLPISQPLLYAADSQDRGLLARSAQLQGPQEGWG